MENEQIPQAVWDWASMVDYPSLEQYPCMRAFKDGVLAVVTRQDGGSVLWLYRTDANAWSGPFPLDKAA